MTVLAAQASVTYLLNGAALGPFDTVWPFEQPSDVEAWLDTGTAGGASLLAAPLDYTLTAPSPLTSGGAVTLNGALLTAGAWPAGSRLTLQRGTASGQPSAFGEQVGFSPGAVEAAIDHIARQVQDLQAQLAQAIAYRQDETPAALPPPNSRRGLLAVWSQNGDASLTAAPLSSLAVGAPGGNVMAVGLFTALGAIVVPAGTNLIQTSGYQATGKGAARYALSPTQAGPATVTHVQTGDGAWWDLAEPMPTPQMFGAYCDGVTDDTPAWQSAAAWGGTIWHVVGTSALAQSVTLAAPIWVGAGAALKPGVGITVTFSGGLVSPFGSPWQNVGTGLGTVLFQAAYPPSPLAAPTP